MLEVHSTIVEHTCSLEDALENDDRSDYIRQIDRIEIKIDLLQNILHGSDKIGLIGKVDVMWGYRGIFVGLFSVNIISLITIVLLFIKQGGH